MEFKCKVKWCPICEQGWVQIVKDKAAKILFLCCSECETEWTDPNNITEDTCSFNTFGVIEKPTNEEIKALKWDKFILK